jgi:hypothetical protein
VAQILLEIDDPVAETAARLIAHRSHEGFKEYGARSILERKFQAVDLCNEAIDEAVDMVIYLVALREKLKALG